MVSKNPVAIVTGGSRGVGAASAKLLASNGWNVIITCSSSIDQAEKIASQCSNQLTEVIAIKADVAQDKDCCLTVDAVIKKWGRLRIQRELKLRQISEYNIKAALKELTEEEYNTTFWSLFEKRKQAVRGNNPSVQKKKIISYMVYRGWEIQKIYDALQEL